MDCLSVLASVIAVIQISGQVFDLCRTYYLGVRDARKDIQRLRDEVTSLQDILTNIADLSDTSGSPKPSILGLNQPDGPLQQCRTELIGLAAALEAGQGKDKMKQFGLRALKWPLSSKDVDKAIMAIGRYKATFNLALSVTMHQSFTLMRIDDQREKIHQWLSAPDPSSNHNDASKKRQATTGAWFVGSEQFGHWKTNPDSFLWVHGIPGCGKTILASTVVEDVLRHCHSDSTLAVVYFYFDFNDVEKRRHEKMIRSLITQLSIISASTPRALESLFSSKMDGKQQPTTGELLKTLRQVVGEFEETFIILDALDECNERQELLSDIEEIAEWKTGRLHILATSRREKDIEEWLEPLVNDRDRICIQSALVNDDICTYVHERLQTDRRLKRWRGKLEAQQRIEQTLMNKADGMFRWAVCQLDALGDCYSLRELWDALESLPITLDDTYAQILCKIQEKHSQHALKILQWLAYSARPLKIEELAEVIAVDIEDDPRFDSEKRFAEPQDILAICSSLVTTTVKAMEGPYDKTAGVQVRLAHFSVKEYLVSERIRTGPAARYSILEMRAHVSIAETCTAYLLQFDGPNSLTLQTFEEFPLARYAAQFWTQHARVAGKDMSVIHQLIMEFFLLKRDAFVNWIRLFDLESPWEELNITMDLGETLGSVPSPLYYASLTGLVESTRLLLDKGADVNARGGVYSNALQAASYRGHHQIVQRLLEAGANVNAQGGRYGNALCAASHGGHHQIFQQLLKAGTDVNAQGARHNNALQSASLEGHEQIVQRLLEAGADVNARGGYGNALYVVSHAGHDQIVQQLLEAGADVNAQGGRYNNALQAASLEGHDQIVQRLLEASADVNAQGGVYGNALQAAAYNGHKAVVQRLLQNGLDVNLRDSYHRVPLHLASRGDRPNMVDYLLSVGADWTPVDKQGCSALHHAASGGSVDALKKLLELSLDPQVLDSYNWGPLHWAARNGNVDAVQLLLDAGADPQKKDRQDRTPLDVAASASNESVVTILSVAMHGSTATIKDERKDACCDSCLHVSCTLLVESYWNNFSAVT